MLAFTVPAIADPGDFVIGAGVESDSEDGLAFSLLGDIAVGQDTWLSASASHSGVDGPARRNVDYLYADIGIDHFFDPVGMRVSVAYWGNSDLLDSNDIRGSVYSRGDRGSISIDAERRDFDFTVPELDAAPRVGVGFDANGLGLTGRLEVSPAVSLRASGMSYEYSRDFRIGDAPRLLDLLTFSRLSVLTSLVDWRANAGIDIDIGLRQLQFSVSKWRGIVDRSDNIGATISILTPLTRRSDVEFSLGYDDSDRYGDVTYLSAFIYFYGGN
ncbi:MAG: hypothetical protein HKN77_04895 [Woeseiaceae bacterium]|nr:hypothetical protein [Woeseiaceae bacterium]